MSIESPPALFAWPTRAAVARVLPKAKIYEHGRPGTTLRGLFVTQVEQVVWAFKLAPETVNLPAGPGVPEIELFQITLKTPRLDDAVLRCIDRAIPFPLLFELRFQGRSQAVAAYKRPSEANAAQWVLGDYFTTPWQDDTLPRSELPLALDLSGLYHELLRAHLPLAARAGENLREQLERVTLLRSMEASAHVLAARLARERQFNRKVELNARLRTIRHQLENLSR